jgi:hypothetical protein
MSSKAHFPTPVRIPERDFFDRRAVDLSPALKALAKTEVIDLSIVYTNLKNASVQ